ncbi:Wings apart-like protein homolog [Plakobranchus ocellatus]|uniref:Wings apart-like protein homolog n=1 Tax=Plakobranchus ocellatus TaxID=259542 RepID=A0AAV4D4N2_9GAST|nr:Wings apart-like protein homolog [Plakobranchus ocellatus]
MNEEEMTSPRFTGRTYSRTRQNAASKMFDEAAGSKTVSVKAAMSLSKWGNTKIVPYRDGSDGATEAKRVKVETKGEDPFSFDTEDKRKSPVKKHVIESQQSETRYTTKLPASRININEKGARNESEQPVIRTYSRTTPKKQVPMEQLSEESPQLSSPGKSVLMRSAKSESTERKKSVKDEDSDDEIFPVQFKREPLKTYSGDVVTPVDKPDSPPPRKSNYKRKGGPRGRRPLTVSDPALIEEYKRNYAAQQLKSKPDTSTGGLNNTTVVSKKEMANSDQGTTVVVVCKPKAQVEKTEVATKYFTKTSKPKHTLTPVVSDSTQAQSHSAETRNGESTAESTPPSGEFTAPTRTSARLRSSGTPATTPEGLTSPSSAGSATSSSVSTRVTRGRSSGLESSQSASSDGNTQGDGSSGRNKRYRIFKSRTPQIEDNLKPPVFQGEGEDEESPIPSLEQEAQERPTDTSEPLETVQEMEITPESADTSSFTPEESSQVSATPEPVVAEGEVDSTCIKEPNPSAARELLAARLRNMEKNNDSDSNGEQDNLSECSEGVVSQESPSNSQKESSAEAPRRFFKSKKSLSGSSDLHKKIFSNSPQKSPAKATYNARSWYNDHEADNEKMDLSGKRSSGKGEEDIMLVKDSEKGPKLKREVHWPERKFDEAYTSLKVNKTHKELYTVVHNVKQTHEVQELGETQDFIDDVNYLLESLRDTNSTSIRCLSCLKLAGKCISPAFRMHMRAHGTVSKIFSLLHDACSDPCLALSTSTMMFMLSRDRLNMDLDQESLELMLRLNEVDAADRSSLSAANLRDLEKTKQRVQELLAELQQELHAKEIDLGFVSTGNLAMESLLSLTSRRAGEWFKEELRSAGGLDHIVDSVRTCEKSLPSDLTLDIQKSLPVLRKLDRCLRVLENISFQNSDNQSYLISYKKAALLKSCSRTLSLCQACMPSHKVLENAEDNKAVKDLPGYTVLTCILAILRVLLNITHEHKLGELDSNTESSLIESILKCLLSTQWCVPMEQRFDLAVLCLGLLINLVENRVSNRQVMMDMSIKVKRGEQLPAKSMKAVHAVVELFVLREAAAHEMEEDASVVPPPEASPNKSGEWKESDSGIQWITSSLQKVKEEMVQEQQDKSTVLAKEGGETPAKDGEGNQSILEDDEETFTKALHKAGKHMENSIVASYAGLLLGTIIMDNKNYAAAVKELIPNGDFVPMIKILKKFLNFMSLTTAFGSTDVNGITRVIEVLEAA